MVPREQGLGSRDPDGLDRYQLLYAPSVVKTSSPLADSPLDAVGMNHGSAACEEKVSRLDGVDSPRNSRSAESGSASPLAHVSHRLRCPVCRGRIQCETKCCVCLNPLCRSRFAVIDGVPHLLVEKSTVFQPQDRQRGQHPFPPRRSSSAKLWASRALPTISKNIRARENYLRFAGLLKNGSAKPHVLVIGGATVGAGFQSILFRPSINFVESDVYLSERTALVCDAHDIPFEDQTFDGVIVQAVLEHVPDPGRCVEEIHRVLKKQGVVYADTPFMQQVHAGGYDFTRFTHMGQRCLFRKFEE